MRLLLRSLVPSVLLASACSFDGTGLGDGSASGSTSASSSDETTAVMTTTTEPTTSVTTSSGTETSTATTGPTTTDPTTSGPTTSGPTTSGPTTTEPTTEPTTSTATTVDPTTSTSTTGEPGVCGDGMLDGDEECDDGNEVDEDACTSACVAASCGDGIVHAGVEACDDGNDVDDDACSNMCEVNESRRVFVTTQTWTGNLGGLAGANAKCQDAADAAGLGGTYKAWIATGKANEAPADHFSKSTAPYVRVDGEVIAANWDDLVDAELAIAINVTEDGVAAGGTNHVWTNVKADGTRLDAAMHCTDFTNGAGSQDARVGVRNGTDQKWTDENTHKCSDSRHLYCFEQ